MYYKIGRNNKCDFEIYLLTMFLFWGEGGRLDAGLKFPCLLAHKYMKYRYLYDRW